MQFSDGYTYSNAIEVATNVTLDTPQTHTCELKMDGNKY